MLFVSAFELLNLLRLTDKTKYQIFLLMFRYYNKMLLIAFDG